jgi:hypothetical protein
MIELGFSLPLGPLYFQSSTMKEALEGQTTTDYTLHLSMMAFFWDMMPVITPLLSTVLFNPQMKTRLTSSVMADCAHWGSMGLILVVGTGMMKG